MSFCLWIGDGDEDTDRIDLGPTLECLAAFKEIAALDDGAEFGELYGVIHTNDETASPEYLAAVREQAGKFLEQHKDDLSEHAAWILGELSHARRQQEETAVGMREAWDESKHPRGQPENAGEFGPGGGEESAPPASTPTSPAQAPAPKTKKAAVKVILPKHAPISVKEMSHTQTKLRLKSQFVPRPPREGEVLLWLGRPQVGPHEFATYSTNDFVEHDKKPCVIVAAKPGFSRSGAWGTVWEQVVIARPATDAEIESVKEQAAAHRAAAQPVMDRMMQS